MTVEAGQSGRLDVATVAEEFADLAVKALISGQTDFSAGSREVREDSLTGLRTGDAVPKGRPLVGSKAPKTVSS